MQIYEIQSGDSLWQLAERYGTTLEEIQKLNALPDPDRLVVGQAILLPTIAVEALRYTVVAGDTLYLLAQLFSTTVAALVQENNITNPDQIAVGMSLVIPDWSQIRYSVRSGDSLYQIATHYGVALPLIVKINHLANPALIYPDQILIIPQPNLPVVKPAIQTLGYFHPGDLDSLEKVLVKINPYITYGALFEYPVGPDGVITVSENTEAAVALLKQFQIRPLVTLTNTATGGFNRDLARTILSTDTVRRQVIDNLLDILVQYDLTGVNIDFENMYPEDRPLYTNFIAELTETLNSYDYLATIVVPPKSADLPTSDWAGAFDYAALGAAANLIFLMAYEWGGPNREPDPIAPLDQVRQVIAYATALIPPEKLIQGTALYGYDWSLPSYKTRTVELVAVYDLAYNNNAAINFDRVAQSPWFDYTDTSGVRHQVWFEDARSVQTKYELAREFALSGVGFWSPYWYTRNKNEPYGFPQNWLVLGEIFDIVK